VKAPIDIYTIRVDQNSNSAALKSKAIPPKDISIPEPFSQAKRHSHTFIRLSTRVLLGLEQLLVDKHLVILPHDLALQNLSVLDKPFEFLDDKDRLCRDASVTDEGDDRVRIPDKLKEDWLNGRVVAITEGSRWSGSIRCTEILSWYAHEEDHVEFRRIPDGQALHHLLSSLLFFPFDMRRFTDHDSDQRQGIDIRPSKTTS
jgi:hypothetical protein